MEWIDKWTNLKTSFNSLQSNKDFIAQYFRNSVDFNSRAISRPVPDQKSFKENPKIGAGHTKIKENGPKKLPK